MKKHFLKKVFFLFLTFVLFFISNIAFAEWEPLPSSKQKNWRGVTTSSDGSKVHAVAFNDYIYTSNDGGMTWLTRTSAGQKNWWDISSSADGNKIIARIEGGGYSKK
jgi:photosystem II stability/assembly factor-like uncharacterized protein